MTKVIDIPSNWKLDKGLIRYQVRSMLREIWNSEMKVIAYSEYEFTIPAFLYRVIVSDDKEIKIKQKGKVYTYDETI